MKDRIYKANLAKSTIVLSLFFSSIATRLSYPIFVVLVGVTMWPVVLIHYCITKKYEKRVELEKVRAK